ncbi:MAG: NFACT RNA binding domain-containing protein [Deltaproteobacteria bacterium]
MDAFLLKPVIAELASELPGALVSKVHQPGEKEIVLELWTGRGEKRLLLSADPETCRIHRTTRKTANPPSPPRFCQYLRKHLEGMRIAGFTLAPYDRSVRIDFSSSRPGAEHAATSLYAELFGRHANLIYVDGDGTILDALRPVSAEESRIRVVLPGIPYRPLPKPERVLLPDVTREDAARIFAGGWEGLAKALTVSVAGLGREAAQEAAARGKGGPGALYDSLRELVRRYEESDFAPGIGTLPNGRKRILPFPCPAAGFAEYVPFPSANTAADVFYAEVSEERETAALRQQLRSRIGALMKKERRKLDNVGEDENRLAEGLKGAVRGETLKANLPSLKKGMTSFGEIPIDPAKTPVENMTRYFHLARKAKGAMEIVRKRKRAVTEGVYYLESLEDLLDRATTRDELAAVRRELSSSFPSRGRSSDKKKISRKDAPRPVLAKVEKVEFRGYAILVGRNNVGNDRIVKELCAPDDLWLHAQGIPGSHVLVKHISGQEVPKEVIEEAARLAVYYSKAKGSKNVPVFLAEARHVSKFKRAKPGLVRISKYSTVFVR